MLQVLAKQGVAPNKRRIYSAPAPMLDAAMRATSPKAKRRWSKRMSGTVEVTVKEAMQILQGLKALDGFDRVVKDGNVEKIVNEPYKFSPNFIWMLTKNSVALLATVEKFELAKSKIIKEEAGADKRIDDKDTVKVQAVMEKINVLLEEKEELKLGMITMGELNLGENKIPPSALAKLGKLLAD